MTNPHDRLVKSVFGVPEFAAALVQVAEPPALVRALHPLRLQRMPSATVDAALSERVGDLCFAARTGLAPVQLLIEHQSRPDNAIAWRILRYKVRLWDASERAAGRGRHPVLIARVLYNGPRRWRPPELAAMFSPDDSGLLDEIPEAKFRLWDVADLRVAEEQLGAIPWLTVESLYLGTRAGVSLTSLHRPMAAVAERPSDNKHLHAVESVLRYLTMVRPDIELSDLQALVAPLKPPFQKMALTLGQRLLNEGFEKGIEEGERLGLDKGHQLGLDEGRRLGLDKGRRQIAARLARRGLPLDVIAADTGLTVDEIRTLAEQHHEN